MTYIATDSQINTFFNMKLKEISRNQTLINYIFIGYFIRTRGPEIGGNILTEFCSFPKEVLPIFFFLIISKGTKRRHFTTHVGSKFL